MGAFDHTSSQPATRTSDISSSDWYQEMEGQARVENVAKDAATDDLIGMLDTAPAAKPKNDFQTLCPSYPGSKAGIVQCHDAIASAFESRAGQCTGSSAETCRLAMFRSAQAARCLSGRTPSPDLFEPASESCMRSPQLLAQMAWYSDRSKQLEHARELSQHTLAGQDIDPICVDTSNPSICDLFVKVHRSKERGTMERTNTPFLCGHGGGKWEGDIVNGRCRLPGDTRPTYDPYRSAQDDFRWMSKSYDYAMRERAKGNDTAARIWTMEVENTFARVVMQLTTATPEQRKELLAQALPLIEKLSAQ